MLEFGRNAAVGLLTVMIAISQIFTAPKTDENSTNIDLYARSAVLMDADTGRVLFEKNGYEIMPMASTTKIMTCILALEYGNLEDYVKVSSYAASMPKVKLYMKSGEYYKLQDLLYSLMLESHNDSAVAIAEHIAGSMEAFAEMMNQKARDIGCADTCFITPNGLDAATVDGTKTHSTTAADLASIMSYCIMDSPEKEKFIKITGAPSYQFTNYKKTDQEGSYQDGGRNFNCRNHNAYLNMMEGAFSGKTGFTGNAGYCYVGAVKREERTFVVALLACGWPNNKTYKWSDTRELMNYGIDHYFYRNVYQEKQLDKLEVSGGIPENQIPYGTAYAKIQVETGGEEKISWLLKEEEQADVKVTLPKILRAPVSQGDKIGYVTYYLNGKVMKEYPIVVMDTVKKMNFNFMVNYLIRLYCL